MYARRPRELTFKNTKLSARASAGEADASLLPLPARNRVISPLELSSCLNYHICIQSNI
jgi:hypothetical protein